MRTIIAIDRRMRALTELTTRRQLAIAHIQLVERIIRVAWTGGSPEHLT